MAGNKGKSAASASAAVNFDSDSNAALAEFLGSLKGKEPASRLHNLHALDILLAEAVAAKRPDMAKLFISLGASPNRYSMYSQDRIGYGLPMGQAVKNNDVETVRALIEGGAEVNLYVSSLPDESVGLGGYSYLHYAIAKGYHEIAALLIAAGADPNARRVSPMGWKHPIGIHEPIMSTAVEIGDPVSIGLLVEAGARLNDIDNHGLVDHYARDDGIISFLPPLINNMRRAINSDPEKYEANFAALKILVENGADVNYLTVKKDYHHDHDITILREAIVTGIKELVAYLLEHGAKLAGTPNALDLAVSTGNKELVAYLLEHGATLAGTHKAFKELTGTRKEIETLTGTRKEIKDWEARMPARAPPEVLECVTMVAAHMDKDLRFRTQQAVKMMREAAGQGTLPLGKPNGSPRQAPGARA